LVSRHDPLRLGRITPALDGASEALGAVLTIDTIGSISVIRSLACGLLPASHIAASDCTPQASHQAGGIE
jgi:hypothetical protein